MTSDRERELLRRCLLLELRIAVLEGIEVAPPLEPIERRSLYESAPAVAHSLPAGIVLRRRTQRRATPSEIAQMRALRSLGTLEAAIARQTGFSTSTARVYTRDVLIEREVGA